ncbi:hypothetical protein M231_04202 [Tremella mesenterica]|uniref:Uncharacterized protein n=1 Tax=Tremella mesenterica TaxID=5217 RepID=A0A4Q1BLA1_TREME|nr:uncharacterized protein TREMEDRAFT_56245 [Tremella mesenterica DSM 1558]EIW73596.1 hypothetical protein TREMEDRAFT_56245 [Tremella mesenterica DSM 1558]RXK38569.1 hypothetical protein M231_04202 [Tremella mesenterica]
MIRLISLIGWLVFATSLVSAQLSTIYWPVNYPNANSPWVVGQKNFLSWITGGGVGIESFDIQLHHWNQTILNGFYPIALRVPMERLSTGRKNFGGELEVDLDSSIPVADGYILVFMNTLHGSVYAKSQKFSILASAPSNYTSADLPTATATATLTGVPNPTQQWALTLNGIDPDATASAATMIAGNAGSGH